VGVRVDKAGQQPSLPDEFSISDRVVSPLIAVCVQIDDIATRQGATPYPQNTHDGTLLDGCDPTPPVRTAGAGTGGERLWRNNGPGGSSRGPGGTNIAFRWTRDDHPRIYSIDAGLTRSG
jgi:hypothetical protein